MIYCRSRMRGIPSHEVSIRSVFSQSKTAHLLVLESHKNHLLHERQLWLLAPFRILADVSRVEHYLVAILGILVGGFWRTIAVPFRCG